MLSLPLLLQTHYSFVRLVPQHESQFWALLRNHLDRIGLVVLEVSVQLLQLERCFLALRLDPVPDEGRRHDVTGETERGVAGSGIAAAAGRNVRKISGSGLRTLLIQLQQEW